MAGVEDAFKSSPILTHWLILTLGRFRKHHYRFVQEELNRDEHSLDSMAVISGAESYRVPPYVWDAAAIALIASLLISNSPLQWKAASLTALTIAASIIAFRAVSFLAITFVHAAFFYAPIYNRRLIPFAWFPGMLFRVLFSIDIVLPQTLFVGWLFGGTAAIVAAVASFSQVLFRIWQGHHLVSCEFNKLGLAGIVCLTGTVLYFGSAGAIA